MADALCGPSNALQTFQKQASGDRTLQQDRSSSRRFPSESFRTQGPNAGALDGEYEAFNSGYQLPLPSANGSQLAPFDHPAITQAPPQTSSSWAADFQKLQVSGPRPLSGPLIQSYTSPDQYTPSQHSLIKNNTQSQENGAFAQAPMPSQFLNGGHGWAGPQIWPGQQSQKFEEHSEFTSQLEDAFQREFAAFEDIRTSADTGLESQQVHNHLDHNRETQSTSQLENDKLVGDPAQGQLYARSTNLETQNDSLEDHNKDFSVDNDELSRTAGHLLDSVGDNQSQKFQNSSFLALMRRLRDKEVTVQGDKMIEVHRDSAVESYVEEAALT